MSGLVFQYGDYQHKAGEVYPQLIEVRPVLSDRGFRWATDIRMTVAGSLCRHPTTPLTPADIDAEINGIISAYQHDYQDFGFLLPDGTRTAHFIENDDAFNLSGNKVIARSWLYESAAEFANTRSYQISLGARILESYSEILFFQEEIALYGNGGPSWSYRSNWTGPPTREEVAEQTPVVVRQSGKLITLSGPAIAPAPWFDEEFELGERRVINRIGATLHGYNQYNRPTHFGLQYEYYFMMPTVPGQQPSFWVP